MFSYFATNVGNVRKVKQSFRLLVTNVLNSLLISVDYAHRIHPNECTPLVKYEGKLRGQNLQT